MIIGILIALIIWAIDIMCTTGKLNEQVRHARRTIDPKAKIVWHPVAIIARLTLYVAVGALVGGWVS